MRVVRSRSGTAKPRSREGGRQAGLAESGGRAPRRSPACTTRRPRCRPARPCLAWARLLPGPTRNGKMYAGA